MPLLQHQTEAPSTLERPITLSFPPPPYGHQGEQKRMLIALGVVLVALFTVVVKDWDFWFPPKAEVQEAVVPVHRASTAVVAPSLPAAAPAMVHGRKPPKTPTAKTTSEPPFAVSAQRTVLPPLQMEVVAGNRHTSVPPRNNEIRVAVDDQPSPTPPRTAARAVVSAANRVQMSPQAAQNVRAPVPPDYPLLARQMRVQGAVTLQALISRDGTIQELHILSGPAILADAAREAVRQWRFKPYLLNGEPVETQAQITVNFTILTN